MVPRQIHVLCDHDALYAAIDLKLGRLDQVHITRLEADLPDQIAHRPRLENCDLLIWAALSPAIDPASLIPRCPDGSRLGSPVLVISDKHPSRAESEDGITFLNFPFDLDELAGTVRRILDKHAKPDCDQNAG